MNIGVDLQPLYSASKKRGMGVYSRELLLAMFELDKENQYFLLNVYDMDEAPFASLPENVHLVSLYMGENKSLLCRNRFESLAQEQLAGKIYRAFLQRNHIDVFFNLSPFDEYVSFQPEWFEGVPCVAIIYDLIPYLFPEKYFFTEFARENYMSNLRAVTHAQQLYAISQDTKDSFVKHVQVPEEKIEVILAGVAKIFQKKEYTQEQLDALKQKFGMQGEFLFMPGADDPRKNVAGTVLAYARLPEEIRQRYQLVFSGGMRPFFLEEMAELIRRYGLEGRVKFLGFVSFDELVMLYNTTRLVVFPSHYEGFGLPVAEAFACGAQVVTSNCSALLEVGGDACVLVNPFDVDDIATGITRALEHYDEEAYAPVVRRRLEEYQWTSVAAKVLDKIKALEPKRAEQTARKRIAVFVTTQDARVLPRLRALAGLGDLLVFAECNGMIGEFEVKRHEAFYAASWNYVVYLLPAQEDAAYMLRYMKNYEGVVELTDKDYHGFFAAACRDTVFDWAAYRQYIEPEYARETEAHIARAKSDAAYFQQQCEQRACFLYFARHCVKLLVPDHEMRERCLQADIGLNVRVAPMQETQYAAVVADQSPSLMDEALLRAVRDKLRLFSETDYQSELRKVTRTLAYLMEQDAPTEQEPDTAVGRTMQEIHRQMRESGIGG